jgi:hypothetical protein
MFYSTLLVVDVLAGKVGKSGKTLARPRSTTMAKILHPPQRPTQL